MDTLYTVLIGGGKGPRISDNVDQAPQRGLRTFPYLAPPNPPGPDAQRIGGSGHGGKPDHERPQEQHHDHSHHKFGHFEF